MSSLLPLLRTAIACAALSATAATAFAQDATPAKGTSPASSTQAQLQTTSPAGDVTKPSMTNRVTFRPRLSESAKAKLAQTRLAQRRRVGVSVAHDTAPTLNRAARGTSVAFLAPQRRADDLFAQASCNSLLCSSYIMVGVGF